MTAYIEARHSTTGTMVLAHRCVGRSCASRTLRHPGHFVGNRDNVTGFVLKSDLLEALAEDRHDATAAEFKRPVLTVEDTLPLPRLFDRLLERQEHLAIVVGEFGGTAGFATIEDVVKPDEGQ